MKLSDLISLLKTIGIPVVYGSFQPAQETYPPFIQVSFDESNNFKADDVVYKKNDRYLIDLVTDKKDVELEEKTELLFFENNIAWDSDETFIPSELIYQHTYYI